VTRFWKMDVNNYPQFSHMEPNESSIHRSSLEILSEIVLQLVVSLLSFFNKTNKPKNAN